MFVRNTPSKGRKTMKKILGSWSPLALVSLCLNFASIGLAQPGVYPPPPNYLPQNPPVPQCFADQDCSPGATCDRGVCREPIRCSPILSCGDCTESGFRTCRVIDCSARIQTFDERCTPQPPMPNTYCSPCFYEIIDYSRQYFYDIEYLNMPNSRRFRQGSFYSLDFCQQRRQQDKRCGLSAGGF